METKRQDSPFSAKLAALQSLLLMTTLGVAALLVIFAAEVLSHARTIAKEVEEDRATLARHEGRIILLSKDVHDQLRDFRIEAASLRREQGESERQAN